MSSLDYSVREMLFEDFVQAFLPDLEILSRKELTDLLKNSMRNRDVSSRIALANLLIDSGADAAVIGSEGENVLHIFASRLRDPELEVPLLERLLRSGADPNQQSPRYGMPLDEFMRNNRFTEDDLAPIYSVWFAHPDLDFFKEDRFGDSLWDRVCRGGSAATHLVQRARAYIEAKTGAPAPAPRFRKQQPNGSWFHFTADDRLTQDIDGKWRVEDDQSRA